MAHAFIRGGKISPTGIFATGPAGNGKTTFLELLEGLFRPKFASTPVCRIDMSQIFSQWGMKLTDALGVELRTYIPSIKAGRFVPDEPTLRTYNRWLEEILTTTSKRIFLFGGFPRTPGQLTGLEKFTQSIVLYRPTNKEQSDAAIIKRWEESKGKPGNELRMENSPTPEQLQIRWDEAQATAKAMQKLGDKCLHLSPTANLHDRLTETLTVLQKRGLIPEEMTRLALNRLRDPRHPIRKRIAQIEGTLTEEEQHPDPEEKYRYSGHKIPIGMQLSRK